MSSRAPDERPVRSFVSQTAVLFAANAGTAVLSGVYAALAARLLGPGEYGSLAAALAVSYFFTLITGPLETGVSKLASSWVGDDTAGHLRALAFGSLRRLLVPIAVGATMFLVAGTLATDFLRLPGWRVWLPLTIYLAALVLACAPRGAQRGAHHFVAYGVTQIVEAGARLGFGALALLLGLGAGGAMAGYAAGMSAAFGVTLWQLRALRRTPAAAVELPSTWALSGPLLCVYVYLMFVVNADVIAAKRYLAPVDAGTYGAASTLARMMYLAATPIYQVLFARVARLRAQGRPARGVAIRVSLGLALGLAVSNLAPWLFGAEMLSLFFGPAYASGAAVLRVQWLSTSLMILQWAVTFALVAADRTRYARLLLVPCVCMTAALVRWHASPHQVALDGLAGTLLGWLAIAVMVLARPQKIERPGKTQ